MAKTLSALQREAKFRLEAQRIETALLDVRLLVQAATGLSREAMIADPDLAISDLQVVAFENLLQRRLAREPVSRILGEREFYGRVFRISPDVLDPRADTETLIDAALVLQPKRILDLGAGSGAIVLTLLCEFPDAHGVGVDVSAAALAVTLSNAKRLQVADRFTTLRSSWFGNVEGRFDLIVSNPPYIPRADIHGLDVDVKDYDPHLALDGGSDGLDCYRAIAAGALAHLMPQGYVLVEIGAGQEVDISQIFQNVGMKPWIVRKDLSGWSRILGFHN